MASSTRSSLTPRAATWYRTMFSRKTLKSGTEPPPFRGTRCARLIAGRHRTSFSRATPNRFHSHART